MDEALALQEAAGLDIINDGEQRRMSFLGSLLECYRGPFAQLVGHAALA